MSKQTNTRVYMTFYRSFYDAIKMLDDSDRLQLYDAIVSYGLDGIEPQNLTGITAAFFIAFRPNLDNSRKQYENGRKGGAPKGNSNAAKTRQRTITPPTDYELSKFCTDNGIYIDEQRFLDYNAAKGWVTTNYRVKDWRDAVREWVATGQRKGYNN